MYSFKLNEGQHVCTPEGTMYDPYYIRLLGVYYVTRLRCICSTTTNKKKALNRYCFNVGPASKPILKQLFLCQSKHDKSAS